MIKKAICFVLAVVFFASNINAGSILTKSSDFSKVATYGMGFATYSLEKKSAVEGLKKLETYDILWDLLGKGEEVLLNGDPEAFTNLKDDLLKIKLVLDKVAEVSAAVGAGNYDDALIGTVDAMVGIVNHPVVNLTWEAVKLTYESHKLVLETKASLDIEQLYGIVNYDRRLMGVSASPDTPPLIPVNSASVTYFYDKYLITDSSTRELVKSYVKKVLGEEFPEASKAQKFWYYLLGVDDAAKEDELSELQSFKNKSRGWINSLLTDLNKQVVVNWQQTRLLQQKAEFDKFNAQVGKAFASFDDVVAYFKRKKEIEKEQAAFSTKLAELEKKLSQATENNLRDMAFQVSKESNVFAVKALIIDDMKFNMAFEDLYIRAIKLVDTLDKKTATAVTVADPYAKEPDVIPLEKQIFDLYSSAIGHIKGLSSAVPAPPYDSVTTALTVNDYTKAWQYASDWKQQYKSISDAYVAQNSKMIRDIKIPPPDTEKISADYYYTVCSRATRKAMTIIGDITTAQGNLHSRDVEKIDGMLSYFQSKKYSASGQLNSFVFQITSHIRTVRLRELASYEEYLFTPDSISSVIPTKIQKAKQFISENTYVSMGKINDSGKTIRHVQSIIDLKKNQLSSALYPVKNYVLPQHEIDSLKKLKDAWDLVKIPEDEVIDMLTDETRTLSQFQESTSKLKSAWNGYNPSSEQKILDDVKKKMDTDVENRQTDVDFLEMMSMQWRGWTQSQKVFCAKDTDKGYLYHEATEFEPKNDGYIVANKTDAVSHYITHQEFLKHPKIVEATASLKKLKVYKFIQSNMPNMAVYINNMLTGADYKFATDQNFYSRALSRAIWAKDISQAESIASSVDIKADSYKQKMEELSKLVPATIMIPTPPKDREPTFMEKVHLQSYLFNDSGHDEEFQNIELGRRYIALRVKIKTIIEERVKLVTKQINEENKKEQLEDRIKPFRARLEGVKSKLSSISSKKDAVSLFQNDYTILVRDYSDSKIKDDAFSKELYGLRESFVQKISGEDIKKIQDFYNEFKNAYQSKNENKLLSMISDSWNAGDGTTLDDLEGYFRNMFTVYDTIKYEISNMKISVESISSIQHYIVYYDVEITGTIYDANITRKEKSAVSEMVTVDASGKVKLYRTLSGTWYFVQ
ncbi:MAG: hypothetical protein WCY38_03265 [Endomicrobiia bacterium]